MAAPKDFLTGFNHNVRHKGRGYHVQTEDSGEEIAHVITHLFEGGNILASKKASYAELRGRPDLKARVRSLMEEQHRQMLRELVNGGFDGGAPDAASADVDPDDDIPIEVEAPIERTGFLPPVQKRSGAQTEAPWIDALARADQASGAAAPSQSAAPAGGKDFAWGATPGPAAERPGAYRGAPTHERTVVAPPRTLERTPGPFVAPHSRGPGAPAVLWPTATEAARFPPNSATSAAPPAGNQQAHADAPRHPRPDAAPPAPRPEPTPGPWKQGAPIETVFGQDPGAEKSLDEVILRYLAGERE